MSAALPEDALRELGRTEGGPGALELLVRDQHTRRLALLRALFDTATAAPAALSPPAAPARLRDDWGLLEAAERRDRTAVRSVLLYPLVGPWAQQTLGALIGGGAAGAPELAAGLGHFSALAAAAAIRAGEDFTVRLTARRGTLVLPTLGALRTGREEPVPVEVALAGEVLTLRVRDDPPVTVALGEEGGGAGHDARWRPVVTLPAPAPGGTPVPLDDIDPYRGAGPAAPRLGLSAVLRLDPRHRTEWARSWDGVAAVLETGGAHRAGEAAALLRCLVPLAPPAGSAPGAGSAQCSGTRREAFGAVLTSHPATPTAFAATLVHELQHTKLAALAALTRLHHEDATPRHFAPWRPDPRPFDGLLQGAYSHLALARHWQRVALTSDRLAVRDRAWTEHARAAEQVGAVLPVLAGSGALTREGRVLVNEMIAVYHRLADHPPPPGHRARAVSYVRTARSIWLQRNAT
ncbi:HEXXH motif-containing putative peptide modification protein [Streptomyces sp. NPDC093085]|uniref:aKG-HExxH-type peptide beta-hydroxylase n=1 Tax=Streptomyces sp. NPDC093085 TaxID=3155068 RepID=UPI00344A98F6